MKYVVSCILAGIWNKQLPVVPRPKLKFPGKRKKSPTGEKVGCIERKH